MSKFWLFIFAIITLRGFIAVAAEPAPYDCQFTDKAITIDGKGDEEAWKAATWIEDFRAWWLPADQQKPYTKTKAKLLWDRDYLYFHAEMEDADLYANTKEHQGPMWQGDVFELFFKPAKDKPGYYEFEINPANATMELAIPERDKMAWVKYAPTTHIDMKTAVQLRGTLNQFDDKDEGWSVEGRIPWKDLAMTGGRPAPGEQWTFTLCRVDTNPTDKDKPHLSSSAPLTERNFHRTEDYAPIRFVGPNQKAEGNPFGIEKRVAFTTSKVVGSPEGPMPYTVARAFAKLEIFQALYALEEPGTNDLLVLQHLAHWAGPGRLVRVHNDPAVDHADTVLEIDGLAYGMTLHPDFAHNGYLYVLVNGPMAAKVKSNRIVRYTMTGPLPRKIDPASALTIIEWESNGHNGGDLAFGPDGYLYHAAGDGSSDSDANLRGQDLRYLTSSMIRIDVDHPDGDKRYSVPKDNPFINMPGARPEIWAYGFRNPWRLAFDRKTGQLWVGQNGQDLWEQVYLVHRGENYGWSIMEGGHPFNLNRKQGPTPITPPTVEHPHSEMRSLTGGVVYYGARFPELQGAFIYGDFGTGRIWAVRHDGTRITFHKELARTTMQIVGFRETSDGELLIMDDGGQMQKLVETPRSQRENVPPFPTKLSETGLFASTKNNTPAAGLIRYDVNAALWSDGAAKERFIALPDDGVIDVTPTRGWNCPDGTVLVKTFSLDHRRVETRLITKQLGQWAGYSYQWNDDQSDATLVDAAGVDREYTVHGEDGSIGKQTWHFPSRAECMTCHSRASNFVLGLSTLQLNRDFTYPASGRTDNQLRVLEHLGLLRVDYTAHAKEQVRQSLVDAGKTPDQAETIANKKFDVHDQRIAAPSPLLPTTPDRMPRLADPYDPHADLNLRARSYLHANCAICHVGAGGGNSLMDLEFTTPAELTKLFNVDPQHDRFDVANAKLIAAGHPEASILLRRLSTRGRGQMPPLATSRVDAAAVELLREWIGAMKSE